MFSATRSRSPRVVARSLVVLGILTLLLGGSYAGSAGAQTSPSTPMAPVPTPAGAGVVVTTPTGVGLIEPMSIDRPPAPRIKTYPPITMAPKAAPQVMGIVVDNPSPETAAAAAPADNGRPVGTLALGAGLALLVSGGLVLGARRRRG